MRCGNGSTRCWPMPRRSTVACALRAKAKPHERRALVIPVPVSVFGAADCDLRSEEHTSELQSLMRISYAVFCLKKKHTEVRKTIFLKQEVTRYSKHNANTKVK